MTSIDSPPTPTLPAAYETLLRRVQRPGRYVGGEWNIHRKDPATLQASIALAFPDVYDLGMSYHGFRLLYERINATPHFAAERVFTPWPDFADQLRAARLPLTSLENYRPLHDFEIIGFTLQNELNYTNVLETLDLGQIPLRQAERDESHPLVIGGGEGALSPECLADFFDAFALGDGEEIVFDLLEAAANAKAEHIPRPQLLRRLAAIPGVYVPSLYDVTYHDDGRVAAITPNDPAAPPVVHRRLFDISSDLGSTRPVVPVIRTVQDRAVVEVRRGCVNGCRFCQAGMITRPVRERSVDQIVEIVRQNLAASGDNAVTLLSLSTADYSEILTAVRRIQREFADDKVSVSLPSLKIDAFDIELAQEISTVRKSSFTFAPEAGSERLRAIINKPLDEERFRDIIEQVLLAGWRTLKMYFMIGLPEETDEDLDGIVSIASFVRHAARQHGIQGVGLNVTLSPFSPKAHTPFQWHGQITREEMARRVNYVRDRLPKGVTAKAHNFDNSRLEGALSRGDRRLAPVLEAAWRRGCRFDAWSEQFRPDDWWAAFADCGLDPDLYATRQRDEDEVFPFDHLEAGTGKDFLLRQYKLSCLGRVTQECIGGPCPNCDACGEIKKQHVLPNKENPPAAEPPRPESEKPTAARGKKRSTVHNPSPPAVQRLRLRFAKTGPLRYVAHLDLAEAIHRLLRRAQLPVAHSQGYNPQPRVMIAPPLSLGWEGQGELLDLLLTEQIEPQDALNKLQQLPLGGLQWLDAEEAPLKAPSLQQSIQQYQYRFDWTPTVHHHENTPQSNRLNQNSAPRGTCSRPTQQSHTPSQDQNQTGTTPTAPHEERVPRPPADTGLLAKFHATDQWPVQIHRKRVTQTRDAKDWVQDIQVLPPEHGHTYSLQIQLRSEGGSTLNPQLLLESLFGAPLDDHCLLQVTRLPLDAPA